MVIFSCFHGDQRKVRLGTARDDEVTKQNKIKDFLAHQSLSHTQNPTDTPTLCAYLSLFSLNTHTHTLCLAQIRVSCLSGCDSLRSYLN